MEHQSAAFCSYTSCSDRHPKEGSRVFSLHSVVANFYSSGKNYGLFLFMVHLVMYERQYRQFPRIIATLHEYLLLLW